MLTYKVAGKDTAQEQVEIYNKVFKENASVHRWIHKHYNNPATEEEKLFGTFDGDKLVAINGFLEMQYKYHNFDFKAIQSCDTAVDPEYRNKGIFTRIIMSAEEEFKRQGYDIMIGYPNFNSHHGFLKMGWQEITRTNKLFLPTNIQNMVKHMKGINLTSISNVISWIMWHNIRKYAKENCEIEIIKKETISTEEYKRNIDQTYIYFNADNHMLKWKLEDLVGNYGVQKHGKEICKFIVCRYDYSDELKRANIILSANDKNYKKEYRCAFAKILLELQEEFDLICIWEPQDAYQKECIKQLGFLGNVVAKEGSPFIVKVLTDDAKKREILLRKENWNPMQIETDTMINLNRD